MMQEPATTFYYNLFLAVSPGCSGLQTRATWNLNKNLGHASQCCAYMAALTGDSRCVLKCQKMLALGLLLAEDGAALLIVLLISKTDYVR